MLIDHRVLGQFPRVEEHKFSNTTQFTIRWLTVLVLLVNKSDEEIRVND